MGWSVSVSVYVCLSVCLSVKIVRIGHTLTKIKHVTNYVYIFSYIVFSNDVNAKIALRDIYLLFDG